MLSYCSVARFQGVAFLNRTLSQQSGAAVSSVSLFSCIRLYSRSISFSGHTCSFSIMSGNGLRVAGGIQKKKVANKAAGVSGK